MWRRALVIACVAAAAGCRNVAAPDGIQIEGVRKLTQAGTCQVAMPEGTMGEKGSEPSLGACMGTDTRITPPR